MNEKGSTTTYCSRLGCSVTLCDCSEDGFTGGPLHLKKPRRRFGIGIVAHDRPMHLLQNLARFAAADLDHVMVAMNDPSDKVVRSVTAVQVEVDSVARIVVASSRRGPGHRMDEYVRTPSGSTRRRKVIAWMNEPGLGYAGAVDQLLNEAWRLRLDHLLVLTDDVDIDMWSIERMRAELGGRVKVVGPTVLDQRGQVWSCGGYVSRWTGLPHRIRDLGSHPCYFVDGHILSGSVDLVCGCCMMIDMSLFSMTSYSKEPLWDPSWGFYMEEADFCARVRRHGFEVRVVPAAECRHDVSEASLPDQTKARYFARNNMRYLDEWRYPRRAKLFARAFYLGGSLILDVYGLHEAAKGLREGLRDHKLGSRGMIYGC